MDFQLVRKNPFFFFTDSYLKFIFSLLGYKNYSVGDYIPRKLNVIYYNYIISNNM